jgi:hypothetical protein
MCALFLPSATGGCKKNSARNWPAKALFEPRGGFPGVSFFYDGTKLRIEKRSKYGNMTAHE